MGRGIIEDTGYTFDEADVTLLDSFETDIQPKKVELPSAVIDSINHFDKYLDSIAVQDNIASTDTLAYSINKHTTAIMISMLKRSLEEYYKMPNSATTSSTLSIITTLNQALLKMKQTENSKDLPEKIFSKVTLFISEYIKSVYNVLSDKLTDLSIDKKAVDELKTEFKKIGTTTDQKLVLLKDTIRKEFEV